MGIDATMHHEHVQTANNIEDFKRLAETEISMVANQLYMHAQHACWPYLQINTAQTKPY